MGDKQIHPPHGQGAFNPVGPSGDAVNGGQIVGIGKDPNQEWLQNGMDREDVRIRELQKLKEQPDVKGTDVEKDIDRFIKEHLQARQWYINEADRLGVTLFQHGVPVGIGKKILKAMAFFLLGLMVLGGGFLAFQSLGSGELVADTQVDGLVDEEPESGSVENGGTDRAEDEDQGAGMVDGPRVIVVEPVEEQPNETQVQSETQVEEHHSSEPVQDEPVVEEEEPEYTEDQDLVDDEEEVEYTEGADCC